MKQFVLSAALVALTLTTAYALDVGLDLPLEKPAKPERVLLPGEWRTVPPDPPPPPAVEQEDKAPTFFGSEVKSDTGTIYFVIDVSGSMGLDTVTFMDWEGDVRWGDRLDRAKSELTRAITKLPESFKFNLLAYDCTAQQWMPDLQRAEAPKKAQAIAWVKQLKPAGATGTGDAVALALMCRENSLVILLTDGDPNCYLGSANGSCQDPEEHRKTIRTANTQNATVNVFGICAFGRFKQFCLDVASDNNGTYTSVE